MSIAHQMSDARCEAIVHGIKPNFVLLGVMKWLAWHDWTRDHNYLLTHGCPPGPDVYEGMIVVFDSYAIGLTVSEEHPHPLSGHSGTVAIEDPLGPQKGP